MGSADLKKCNGVFEGGGVRGIGHVGAACGIEEGGYEFVNLAGSSAGAIVAALLAAGYECVELKGEMESLDYTKMKGKDWIDHFGAVGKKISIVLKITVSDLTEKRLLILPDGLREFGVEPDSFSVAAAVKMSVSIPVFFEPVRWKDVYGKKYLMVDGGLLSNYPVWVLDDGKKLPDLPTFGFKFVDEKETPGRQPGSV